MIKKIELNNFKSHKNTNIEIGNLTVLCGSNGVGKSSFIQILLLLREVFIKDKSFEILDLKSDPIKIGTVNDAVYEFGDYDGFQVKLGFDDDFICDFFYEAYSEADKVKSFINLNLDRVENKSIFEGNEWQKSFEKFSKISLFNTNFQYISAARFGPLERYEKDDKMVDVHKQISVIEGKAEYFVHYLDKYRNDDVIDELCMSDKESRVYKDLFTQVLLWEKYIFNGANAEIQDVGKLGYILKYSFDNERSTTKKTAGYDAKNVGFGLSYTLPILVAILSAKKGAIIIIENPEAHLHPNGIAKLTELICIAAQAGIQIIIETHSDHIINGIAVQCKLYENKDKKGLDKDLVKIYQFTRNEKENYTERLLIPIEEGGRIAISPEGFFDQIQIDLEKLLGF
ncbi:TPA: DUF3696 domain-containing protein [Elizabethkingia anophelis]|nr:hypothetical protein [Elizabethkingia anophelis]HAY3539484.1 DUF3696 domain-containing protein [Elizabethkingia anophelis]